MRVGILIQRNGQESAWSPTDINIIDEIRMAYDLYKKQVLGIVNNPNYKIHPDIETTESKLKMSGEVLVGLCKEYNADCEIYIVSNWQDTRRHVQLPAMVSYKGINITGMINI